MDLWNNENPWQVLELRDGRSNGAVRLYGKCWNCETGRVVEQPEFVARTVTARWITSNRSL